MRAAVLGRLTGGCSRKKADQSGRAASFTAAASMNSLVLIPRRRAAAAMRRLTPGEMRREVGVLMRYKCSAGVRTSRIGEAIR